MFENIIGYEAVKNELSTIIGWYTDKTLDLSIRLPRGVLLTGSPGLGKTLFMRAVKESAPLPVYPFVTNEWHDAASDLTRVFEKASEEQNGAIILIDELDALLNNSSSAERCLRELMDGLNSQNRILFLASSNERLSRHDSLSRPGRFDRTIRFSYPTERERSSILLYYMKQYGRTLSQEDLDYIARLTGGCSNAGLAAIVSDACLRNHDLKLTGEMLEKSHALICCSELPKVEEDKDYSLIICVHEIGHAILIDRYREHYDLHRVTVGKKSENCGSCFFSVEKDSEKTQELHLESIEIGLAGFLATKILLGVKDCGSAEDLMQARFEARRLINSFGYAGVDKVLREYDSYHRNESWVTCLRNERLAKKMIRLCERRASRIIRNNRDVILKLAKELQQTGALSGKRIREVLSETSGVQKKHA